MKRMNFPRRKDQRRREAEDRAARPGLVPRFLNGMKVAIKTGLATDREIGAIQADPTHNLHKWVHNVGLKRWKKAKKV